jgi:hypothetical protein
VGPEEGVSRQNWHHNRCSIGDVASARRVGGFGGHDATTRAEPEDVGRRALPKPWLIFKLASGLWPASRCSPSANQIPRPSLSLKRSLAPITALATTIGQRVEDRGRTSSCVHSLLLEVHLHPGIVTMNLSHYLSSRTLRHQGMPSHPPSQAGRESRLDLGSSCQTDLPEK